jgi:D-alanine transaminase
MQRLAYTNGEILPLGEATVSVQDRGFLFGDGVYDVVRIADGRYFRLHRHLERLRDNAEALEFGDIPTASRLQQIAETLCNRADVVDGMLYMQLTRGSGPRQSNFPENASPSLVAYVDELRRGADSLREEGASIVLVPEMRWERCDIKSVNLLPKVLMNERAQRFDSYEAVFVSEQSEVWEGTSTNIFTVEEGTLRTPDHPHRILPGITRREIVDIAADEGIPVEMATVLIDDLYQADEVFLTGTLTEVLGVTDIDGDPVADGHVGPMTRRLQELLQQRMQDTTASSR